VPLRRVARTVKLFVEGLCGAEVSIAALPDATNQPARAAVSADGKTISLPAVLRRYPAAEDNERLYLIMAAHEAGHLEFGTYRLTLRPLRDLIETVRHRYGRGGDMMPDSLAAFFRLYPRPSLVRDLWVVLEDARIEFLLQHAYPGLRNDLAKLAAEAITPRDRRLFAAAFHRRTGKLGGAPSRHERSGGLVGAVPNRHDPRRDGGGHRQAGG
jgi:nitric oxide reductase NorD protein